MPPYTSKVMLKIGDKRILNNVAAVHFQLLSVFIHYGRPM